MSRERSDMRSCLGVPDANRIVVAATGKLGPVRRIRHGIDIARMACKRSDMLVRVGVPDANLLPAGTGKLGAIRRIRHGIDASRMPHKPSTKTHGRLGIPDYNFLTAAAGKVSAIRRIRHGIDSDPPDFYVRARLGIPDANREVAADAGNVGTIRRIRHGIDASRMPRKRSFQLRLAVLRKERRQQTCRQDVPISDPHSMTFQ